MRYSKFTLNVLAFLMLSLPAMATTFVVPTDRDMVHRSDAIVVGTAQNSYTRLGEHGGIETVTAFSIEEVIKGVVLSGSINIVEPGGEYGDRETLIPGVPRFEAGRRMMLMLRRTGNERWAVTDLVLGKFSFETDRLGRSLLVRDESDIVGWDPDLTTHREIRRDAAKFLQFVRTESRFGVAQTDYTVSPAPLLKPSTDAVAQTNVAPYSATSYTLSMGSGSGSRWTVFPNAVNWYRGVGGEPGAPGSGDTAINVAFNSWNGDPASNVNYVYAGIDNGTHTSGLHSADGVNTILFEQNLSSPWGVPAFTCSANGYSGTLGIGGITSASGTNTLGTETFSTTNEADVMMNAGLANCTLLFNNGDFNSAVTHEVGHTLGFRHSDKNRADTAACSTDPSLECSSSAIMTAFVTMGVNGALQVWDQHAVQALYPGSGPTPPPPVTTFVRGDFNGDGKVDLIWRNYLTGAVNIWLMNGSQYISTLTVNSVADPNWHIVGAGDFNGDKRSDLVWHNTATGQNSVWLMNGGTFMGNLTLPTVTDLNWRIEAVNDFNGDGNDDLVWRNYSTGQNSVWLMSGATRLSVAPLMSVADTNWHIVGSGDFNKDGKPDLVWRNFATGAVNVWFLNGTTYTGGPNLYTISDQNWRIEAVGDYNGDGSSDLVWRNYATGAVNIWFLNGTTYMSGPSLYTITDFNWHIDGPK